MSISSFLYPTHIERATKSSYPASKMKPPIRVAVLECDVPLPSIQEEYGGYGEIFTKLLRAGADAVGEPALVSSTHGLEFSTFDIVNHSDRYPRVEDVDVVLLTGSSMPACPSFSGIFVQVGTLSKSLRRVHILAP